MSRRSGLTCHRTTARSRERARARVLLLHVKPRMWRECEHVCKNTAGFHGVASDWENDHMRTWNLPAAGQSSSYVFGEMGSRRSTVIPLTLITEAVFQHLPVCCLVMAANRFSGRKPSNPEGWFLCKRGPGPHRWTAGWNRSRSLIPGSFSSIEC